MITGREIARRLDDAGLVDLLGGLLEALGDDAGEVDTRGQWLRR